MKAFKKWHARVSLRVVVIGVLLGAAGIVGWQFGRMPDNNGIDLRHHKEQSVVISPPAPPASAVQSDPIKVFLERRGNTVPPSPVGQPAPPMSPQEIQDKFREAVNKQQAVRASSPFVVQRASEGTDH